MENTEFYLIFILDGAADVNGVFVASMKGIGGREFIGK
jgi:hypothetical protein